MTRYIDAEKFLKDETKRCGSVPLVGTCTTDNESLAYQLAKAPTADIVEVVRCKDCKFNGNFFRCPFDAVIKCRKDDFCSYGERR